MSKELSHTRVMYVGGPDEIQTGHPTMFTDRAMSERGVRAIGKYRQVGNGEVAVPVVYVSRRAKSWPERHRVALITSGSALVFLAGLGFAIAWVGPVWFMVGVLAMAVAVALISRLARGGRSVSVTTTTTTKVRVR